MNLYILVEGRHTEKKVYPVLIDYFLKRKLQKVKFANEAIQNHYFLISGQGYPRIYDEFLKDSIEDIQTNPQYNYLVVCLDADELAVSERIEELEDRIQELATKGVVLPPTCSLQLIVQNRCIETWFLGNTRVYKQNPSDAQLGKCQQFYNVKTHDPEQMGIHPDFDRHAAFHLAYLKKMLSERRISYSKNNPYSVTKAHYIQQLQQRINETGHLASLKTLLDFFADLDKQIP